MNQLEVYERKAKQAEEVNQKILHKYDNLQKEVRLSEASEQELLNYLPKVQVSHFIEQHKKQFDDLKHGTAEVKEKM